MLKESEISKYSTRRIHRTYTPEFKAALVAASQEPGVSIAALAAQHGMNANVLHRWIKEHRRSGCHQLVSQGVAQTAGVASTVPAFIPVQLPLPASAPKEREITVELRKGALSMIVTWPMSATADFASWTAAILK
jgi:transposase-like protein